MKNDELEKVEDSTLAGLKEMGAFGLQVHLGLHVQYMFLHVHSYTAISRKVVWKSARDNPERHCGWFWVHCSSEKFERIGMKGHENVFASANGKQQK